MYAVHDTVSHTAGVGIRVTRRTCEPRERESSGFTYTNTDTAKFGNNVRHKHETCNANTSTDIEMFSI